MEATSSAEAPARRKLRMGALGRNGDDDTASSAKGLNTSYRPYLTAPDVVKPTMVLPKPASGAT